MGKITNEANDLGRNVKTDKVEGPIDNASRDMVVQMLNLVTIGCLGY